MKKLSADLQKIITSLDNTVDINDVEEIGAKGAKALSAVLPMMSHAGHSLDLASNNIRDEGAKAFSEALPILDMKCLT